MTKKSSISPFGRTTTTRPPSGGSRGSRSPTPQERQDYKRSKSSDAIEVFAMSPTIPPAYAFDDPIHQRSSGSANQSVVDDQSMHSRVCEVENDLFEDEQNIHYLVRKRGSQMKSCWTRCLFGRPDRPKRQKQLRAALCITLPITFVVLVVICFVATSTGGFGGGGDGTGTRGSTGSGTTSLHDPQSPSILGGPGRWSNEPMIDYAYYNDTEFWESADGNECAAAFLLEYNVLRREVLELIDDPESYLCAGDDHGHYCHCPRDGRLEGIDKKDNAQWHRAYEENLDLLHDFSKMSSTVSDGLDVIMYGDEIVEGWWGSTMGEPYEPNGQDHFHVYQELFDNHVGSEQPSVKGLAMGIAHDTIPNLIWRMRKGELPNPDESRTKPPKVVWLLIGYNDFHMLECKKEIILIEILNIALFVRKNLPDTTIVINGLLPISNDHHGWLEDNEGGVNKNPFFKRLDWINKRIECFLRSGFDPEMEYFDPEPYFTHKDNGDRRPGLFADPSRFEEDSKHLPSVEGRQIWGQAIVERVKIIMDRRNGQDVQNDVIHTGQKLAPHD